VTTPKTVEVVEVKSTTTTVTAVDTTALKTKFTELLIPVFGECLLGGVSTEEGAKATVAALEKSGHTQIEFVENVSLPELMEVVAGFQLPEEANPWFEGVYAHLSGTTGVVTG
jgi:hypothetical protein